MAFGSRRALWLVGLSFVACRYGYQELAGDPLTLGGGSSSGGSKSSTTTQAAGGSADSAGAPTDAAGGEAAPGSGGEGATSGGTTNGGSTSGGGSEQGGATQGGTAQGGSPQGGAAQGGTAQGGTAQGGSAQGGTAPLGGAPNCGNSVALTSNASPSVAPPVTCTYPGALVCDDFEGTQKPYWTVIANAPALGSLQDCEVHGGTRALWAQPADAASPLQVQEQLSPTVGSGSLFVRSFIYLPSAQTLPTWTVLYEVWDSPSSWTNKISIDLQPDATVTLNNWTGSGQSKTSLANSAALISRDKWVCLELEIVVSKTTGATRLYLDDVQVITSVGNIRTRGNKDFCTLSMGAVSGDNPISLYQDDLVVATQRIGCK
jgi:hypothetical protein